MFFRCFLILLTFEIAQSVVFDSEPVVDPLPFVDDSSPGRVTETELNRAVRLGEFDLVKSLILGKVDINSVNVLTGETPLMVACQFGRVDIAEFLIDSGADYTVYNFDGLTAQKMCSKNRGFEKMFNKLAKSVLYEMVDAGFDVMAALAVGDTPLMSAIRAGHLPFVLKLIGVGVNVNLTNSENETPLMVAQGYGREEISEALIAAKAVLQSEKTDMFKVPSKKYTLTVTGSTTFDHGSCVSSDNGNFSGTQLTLNRGSNVHVSYFPTNSFGQALYEQSEIPSGPCKVYIRHFKRAFGTDSTNLPLKKQKVLGSI